MTVETEIQVRSFEASLDAGSAGSFPVSSFVLHLSENGFPEAVVGVDL